MVLDTSRHSRRRQLSSPGRSSSPRAHVPTVALSSQEQAYLVAQATRQHEALLAKHHDNLHTFWTVDALMDQVEVCYAAQTRSNVLPFRARTSMAATLEEVYSLVSNLTDADIADTVAHSDELVDMKLLNEISINDEKHVAVRWFGLKQPAPVANRDFCVLEMQEELVDYVGRRMWAVSAHSTHFAWCHDFKSTMGFVRGDILSSGLICTETDEPGIVELHYYIDMDLRGALPMWLYRLRMKQHASARLSQLSVRVHELRLADCVATSYVPLVPKASRRHCRCCTKTFNVILRRKCHCRNCGDVFCWSCTDFWKLEHFKQPQRVCRGCSDHANVRTTSHRSGTSGDLPLKSSRSMGPRSMRSTSKSDACRFKWDLLSSRRDLLDSCRTSEVSSPIYLLRPDPSTSLTSAILQVEDMLDE